MQKGEILVRSPPQWHRGGRDLKLNDWQGTVSHICLLIIAAVKVSIKARMQGLKPEQFFYACVVILIPDFSTKCKWIHDAQMDSAHSGFKIRRQIVASIYHPYLKKPHYKLHLFNWAKFTTLLFTDKCVITAYYYCCHTFSYLSFLDYLTVSGDI